MMLVPVLLTLLGGPVGDGAGLPAGTTSALDALRRTTVNALILESDVHWHRGDYGRSAMAQYLAAELDGAFPQGYTSAAWLAWSWGCRAAAGRLVQREIARHGRDPDALYEAGTLVRLWGDKELALDLLRKAHAINPGDRLTCLGLGGLYRARGDWASAAEVYQTLDHYHPGDPSAARFLERYRATGRM